MDLPQRMGTGTAAVKLLGLALIAAAATAFLLIRRQSPVAHTRAGSASSEGVRMLSNSQRLTPWKLRANATSCKNRADIQLDKRIVNSPADCGAACQATSGCTGFGFMSWSACNGWQTDKATCCLWIGPCEGTYDKCWHDYTMASNTAVQERADHEKKETDQADVSKDDARLNPTDPANLKGLTLLTSVGKLADEDPHAEEIVAALAANLGNSFFDEVHLLSGRTGCSFIVARVQKAFASRRLSNGQDISNHADKLKCAKVLETPEPTYADYFAYSDGVLAGRAIVLAQPDVVFDESLSLVDREAILQQKHGYVLSVKPPPQDSDYKKAFGVDCVNTPTCAVGAWNGGGPWGQSELSGSSWDAFIFAPPVTLSIDMTKIAIGTNVPGSHRLAAYQLETAARISLYNPCEHVHAHHWHCLGDVYAANPNEPADRPIWYTALHGKTGSKSNEAVDAIFPCWECPGVQMPRYYPKREHFCVAGVLQTAEQNWALKMAFRWPWINASICCSDAGKCDTLPIPTLRYCRTADDLDCVIWEQASPHHYY